MKKNFLCLIGSALVVLVCVSPAAASGFYLSVLGGAGFLQEAEARDPEGSFNFSYDAGFDGSVSLGYDLGDKYPDIGRGRVELEFNSAANDMDEAEFIEGDVAVDGSVERTSIMLNTIGEYTMPSGMMIYALIGVGWAEITLDNVSILGEPFVDGSDNALAYQFGLGLGWKLSNHFVFDVGYRFYGTTDPEFTKKDESSLDYEYTGHRILAGLRLHF